MVEMGLTEVMIGGLLTLDLFQMRMMWDMKDKLSKKANRGK